MAVASTCFSADQVLDRVVAQVDGQVITLSDLRFEARVAMVERGGGALADAPLDEATLQSALELAIAQRAAGAEADRLGSFPLEAPDVEARLQRFEAHFADKAAVDSFLRKAGADESQLRDVLGRAMRAERALDARVRLRAQVNEGEVRRAWEAAGSKGSFEDARTALREQLVSTVIEAPASLAPIDAAAAGLEAAGAFIQEGGELAQKRQAIIASSAELQERELIKLASLAAALADALRRRGVEDPAASLTAEAGVAVFKVAFERYVGETDQRDLPLLIRESLEELKAVTAGR